MDLINYYRIVVSEVIVYKRSNLCIFMSDQDSLITKITQSNYLNSIHEVKILAYLIKNPRDSFGKEICNELSLPDSKVYPALNKLVDLGLVNKNENVRPNRYYLKSPQTIFDFFERSYTEEITFKSKLIEQIKKEILELWNPDDGFEDQISHLLKGNDIQTQILRLTKKAKSRILFLLAPPAERYAELVTESVKSVISSDIQVNLAIPQTERYTEIFKELFVKTPKNMRIKDSKRTYNSYIVIDGKLLLHITHQGIGDVGILTTDELLVSYIDSCWVNDECCIDMKLNHELTTHVSENKENQLILLKEDF